MVKEKEKKKCFKCDEILIVKIHKGWLNTRCPKCRTVTLASLELLEKV